MKFTKKELQIIQSLVCQLAGPDAYSILDKIEVELGDDTPYDVWVETDFCECPLFRIVGNGKVFLKRVR